MKCKSIATDAVTYNCLVNEMCRLGQWEEGKNLLNQMMAGRILPDIVTLNILVDHHCKEGMILQAECLIKKMVQRGVNSNVITYNSLMKRYCIQGRLYGARGYSSRCQKEVANLMFVVIIS